MSTKYCMKCHEDVDSDDMVDFLGTPFEICKKCDENENNHLREPACY